MAKRGGEVQILRYRKVMKETVRYEREEHI